MLGPGNKWIARALYAPVVLGALLCLLSLFLTDAPREFVFANLGVYALGFLMFAQATRSLRERIARRGADSVRMTPSNRLLYRIGILLMSLGVLLTFILYNLTFA